MRLTICLTVATVAAAGCLCALTATSWESAQANNGIVVVRGAPANSPVVSKALHFAEARSAKSLVPQDMSPIERQLLVRSDAGDINRSMLLQKSLSQQVSMIDSSILINEVIVSSSMCEISGTMPASNQDQQDKNVAWLSSDMLPVTFNRAGVRKLLLTSVEKRDTGELAFIFHGKC